MYWLGLIIVTVVVAALQTSVVSLLAIRGVEPSLLLAAAIFYGLRWPPVAAGIAGWAMGLAADLTSTGPVGAQSLTFALAAMAASRLRSVLMTDHPIAQMVVTGVLGWLVYTVVFTHSSWRDDWAWPFGLSVTRAGYVALYTALLTPYLFWLLERAVPLLGLQPGKRRRS